MTSVNDLRRSKNSVCALMTSASEAYLFARISSFAVVATDLMF